MKLILSPLDAEAVPDGTFGGPRPASPGVRTPTSPEHAAQHRQQLLAALRESTNRKAS